MGHPLAARNFAEELRGNKQCIRECVRNKFDNGEGLIALRHMTGALRMNVGRLDFYVCLLSTVKVFKAWCRCIDESHLGRQLNAGHMRHKWHKPLGRCGH